MKNLFTMNAIIAASPCWDGIDRLVSGLGVYSGPTVITVDDLEDVTILDILWGIQLLPISIHTQKVVAVTIANYAAEFVLHITKERSAGTCFKFVKNWLDDPWDSSREVYNWDRDSIPPWSDVASIATIRGVEAVEAVEAGEILEVVELAIEAVEAGEMADHTIMPYLKGRTIRLISEL